MISFLCNSELGPLEGFEGAALPHWSAILVALVTLNCFIPLWLAPEVPVLEAEFMPELAPVEAVPPLAVLAPDWSTEPGFVVPAAEAEPAFSEGVPVTWTSLPTRVRKLSKFPVSL